MVGNQQRPAYNFKDPFVAGQLVGMLIVLNHVEQNELPGPMLDQLKDLAASQLQEYFDKPSEDILLMINDIAEMKAI